MRKQEEEVWGRSERFQPCCLVPWTPVPGTLYSQAQVGPLYIARLSRKLQGSQGELFSSLLSGGVCFCKHIASVGYTLQSFWFTDQSGSGEPWGQLARIGRWHPQ